jgi:hypothetical protein
VKTPHFITMMLWITPIVIQSVIVMVMLRRRLSKVFPVFFAYTALVPARELFLLFIRDHRELYFRTYWLGEAIVVALSLAVIYEVIRHVIRPYAFLRRLVLKSFWIVGIAALGVGLTMFVSSSLSDHPESRFDIIILAERSVRFLQACLLIVLILLMSRLGVTWQYYAVGIATGFGVYSVSYLAFLELRAHLHLISNSTLVFLNSAAYNVAVATWAIYFVPPRQRKVVVESLPTTDIAHWNEVLSEYLQR